MTTNTNDAPSLGEELRTAGDRYWGKPKERAAFECGVAWGFHKGLEYAALPEQAAVPPGLKDHEVALLVNRLRDIAMNFHGTQQLRERIAAEIRPAAHALAAAPKAEPVPAGGEYPPLPRPFIGVQDQPWGGHKEVIRSAIGEDGVVSCYTDDQMHAYVDVDRAMRAHAAPQPAVQQGDAEDAARLDWLERQGSIGIERFRYLGRSANTGYGVSLADDMDYEGNTLREAIYAARRAQTTAKAKKEHPHD